MASRFEVVSWRDVAPFFLAALRIRRQMLGAPGAVGVSLVAHPARREFYTLSAWRDRAALDSAVAGRPHVESMTRFRPRMASSLFSFWTAAMPAGVHPEWPEARARLREEADPSRCRR
ncbi:DUF3291 domain-containing protein [Mycobacterium yunnanensis]|uniref:DUF3291 domain-containing protein n=2 Tax=Mycobacterium yunnanensis TaxID=368477 RepID=A0A9X3C1Q8_9MYCO|nr:DUF3291 domain-containing protein [Mycobacterium yunnanensis]